MAPLVGWNVALYGGGTPTAMTAEACTSVSSTVYRITDIDKRIIDPETVVTVYENGVETVKSVVIDYLAGTLTFDSAATAPVTVDGKFIPRGRLACAKSVELNEEHGPYDSTCFKLDGEADAGVMRRILGLFDATGSISHIDPYADQVDTSGSGGGVDKRLVEAMLRNSLDYTILEIQFGTTRVWRGFVIFNSVSASINVDDLINETLSWELAGISGKGYFTEFDYVA